VPIVAAVALATGCTARQARVAHRVGEVSAGAALVGLLACVIAAEAWHDHREVFLDAGLALVPISLAGVGIYVATDGLVAPTEPAPAATVHSTRWDTAMALAQQAKRAARVGDCSEVQAIDPRVRSLDDAVYLRFVNDAVIRTCLGTR
jgi:hypothetical protein